MPIPDLIRRQIATQSTLDRYKSREFQWGKTDCVKITRFHLLKMGHKPPKMPNYSTEFAALRRLKQAGHNTLESMLDDILQPIDASRIQIGDIATVAGEGSLSAIVIYLGNEKYMGFPEEHSKLCVVKVKPSRCWCV